MNKNYFLKLTTILFSLLILSCAKDDEYIDLLPIATNDTATYEYLATVSVNVLANDTAGDIILPTTVSIKGGTDTNSNGSLDKLVVVGEGVWTTDATTGMVVFTPESNFLSDPTPITYTVKDLQGNKSNEAIITITAISNANADLSLVPYPKLSDYHFFVGDIKNQIPSLNVIPYEPSSTLFTDYALKKRFIWMPAGSHATYASDNQILNFPVGTVLFKTFYYDTVQPSNTTKIIETRFMVLRSSGWVFYEYLWNDAQTDAFLVTGTDFENGSSVNFTFKKPNNEIINIDYRVPSEPECFACHKINDVRTPIGPKPQNLNRNFNYFEGSKNQMLKLKEQGYLDSYPGNIVSTVDYHDATQPLELRVRSYLDANCAHCHQDLGRCDYRALRLKYSSTTDPTMMGVCVTADEVISPTLQKIISAGNSSKSIMVYRLSTNDESERMPLLGRTIKHDEGVALIEEWINSLTQTCN